MTSYEKELHKYDKIGDGKPESPPPKPEHFGQETSRYAPGTLESNDPNSNQSTFKDTSREKIDDEEDLD